MKRHLARFALGLLVLLVLLGHSAKFYEIPFISRVDNIFYDAKLVLTMPRKVDERIVILDIDEKSLAELGHWPWGRDKLATMVNNLFDRYHARLLGMDVVYAERDDSSGLKSLDALASDKLRGDAGFQAALHELRPKLDYDNLFAAAIKGRAVVLGYFMSGEDVSTGSIPQPVIPSGAFAGRKIAFRSFPGAGGNIDVLQNTAAGAGYFNIVPDIDGIDRRVPMLVEHKGAYYESLSLAMVRQLLGQPKVVAGFPSGAKSYQAMEWIDLPTESGKVLRIPVDENVASLVPFRGARGSFPYISAADVVTGRVPAGKLENAIVLLGTTAAGLQDLRATPVANVYPGVEMHANLIAGMLDGNIKFRPSYVLGADVMLTLITGLIMVFGLPWLSALRASLVAAIVFVVLLAVNLGAWQFGNLVLPLANGLILVITLFSLNMAWGYFVESRSKRQLTGLFGQYVPPELVEEMSRDPENYSMAGRKAELTVLFSDVRGFTTISEGLEPDQLAALMNEYLGAMTAVIRRNRGTLDKYIGDAIMAFWGAPVDDSEHARHAVITALEMQRALIDLNKALVAKKWPELKIGIGLNTGIMTVGDMGSPVRQSYTVMGDAVNLGSRLEGITKQYGVGIIVGETTREQLKQLMVFRELDRVRVKGKDEPVGIYEPLGLEGEVAKQELDELKLWNQTLRAYRSQDWDQAELNLLNLSRTKPRYLYEIYGQRIAHLRKEPPGSGWDGVTTFETK